LLITSAGNLAFGAWPGSEINVKKTRLSQGDVRGRFCRSAVLEK